MSGIALLAVLLTSGAPSAGTNYSPRVIEVEQPNAWCYILINQNRAVGNIHMLDCVAK